MRPPHSLLKERLWTILLPAFLVFSLIGSTWAGLLMREREETRRVADLERSIKAVVHSTSGEIGHAVATDNRQRYVFLVESLALVCGGQVMLYHHTGGLLAQGSPDGSVDGSPDVAVVRGNIAQLIMVSGPIHGAGGNRLGELRVHVPVPEKPAFPWAVWSGLLAVFCLISAAVLLLVTRVLAPLSKLGSVFRQIGRGSANNVQIPAEGFGEFGQLQEDLMVCVDGLRARQLKTEESFVEVAFALAREYEYHREGEIGHGQRTRRYASWIADRLRLPPKDRDALEVASLCHDIGKMPADDSQRWGTATDPDRAHPILGAAYFDAMPGLEDVARIIRAHHENFDGSGFPDGLAGQEIPIGARALRIADAFERQYAERGDTITPEELLAEMEEGKGNLFDPYLFEFFREEATVHLLERRRLKVTMKAYSMG